MTDSSQPYSRSKGRRFGLTLGVAFAVLSLIASWRGRETVALIFGSIATSMVIAAIVAPSALEPVERAWMALAHAISKITTPIFIGIVYFLLLTPVGLIRRAMGRNALVRPLSGDGYWVRRSRIEPEARRRRMERQF